MEPFEKDELTDRELDGMLPQWKAPSAPARLKAAVFGERRAPWWRRLWSASIRVPVPVACALAVLMAVAMVAIMRPAPLPAPRVVVRTERVEVPVVQERIVYRDRPVVADAAWRPVRELRPRIIKGSDAQ
jgi:hypothetical protein